MKIVNAEGKILGRLASRIAQIARDGEEVKVVNSKEAVISGDESEVKEEYETKYVRGRRDTGPYYPKRADKILKRTVRDMIPYKSSTGKEAFQKVRTYIGVPERFEGEVEEVDVREGKDLKRRNYVKLGEVSEFIGGAEK